LYYDLNFCFNFFKKKLNGDEGENNEIELLRKELADAQRIAEEERRVCAEMCEVC